MSHSIHYPASQGDETCLWAIAASRHRAKCCICNHLKSYHHFLSSNNVLVWLSHNRSDPLGSNLLLQPITVSNLFRSCTHVAFVWLRVCFPSPPSLANLPNVKTKKQPTTGSKVSKITDTEQKKVGLMSEMSDYACKFRLHVFVLKTQSRSSISTPLSRLTELCVRACAALSELQATT